MVNFKLTRDEARACQIYFIDYLQQLCAVKIRDSTNGADKFHQAMIADQLQQFKKILVRKLLNKGNQLTFRIELSQAIMLYKCLMLLPIERENLYLVQLRNLFCNIILPEIERAIFTLSQPS